MIKYDELENAFFYVSSDQQYMHLAVLHKKTGETFYQSDIAGIDEFPEDVENGDYINIPHKNELGLGRDLVFDFVEEYLPQQAGKVNQIFSTRGAYRRFKDFLDSIGLLEDWYKFENEQTKIALKNWCKENGLEIENQEIT